MATKSEDRVHQFTEILKAEIEDIDTTLLPLLRVYINNVREIRMAMASEVKDILRSSQELSTLAKRAVELENFTRNLLVLKQVLTPELIAQLKEILK